MERYIYFGCEAPAIKFLKDRRKWKGEIKDLQKQIDEYLHLKAVANSEVHSGNISKMTENSAIDILELQDEIARRERYITIFENAMASLTEDERALINGFHFGNRMVSAFVDEFAYEHNCERSTVYNRKIDAEREFARAVRVQL